MPYFSLGLASEKILALAWVLEEGTANENLGNEESFGIRGSGSELRKDPKSHLQF